MNDESKKFIKEWIDANVLTFASAILLSMIVVEKYFAVNSSHHHSKLDQARHLLPIIIDISVEACFLTSDRGRHLKNKFVKNHDLVEEIMKGYSIVAKNPKLIQHDSNSQSNEGRCPMRKLFCM